MAANKNYEVLHYGFSSVLLFLIRLRFRYFPQHPVLEHPRPVCFLNVTKFHIDLRKQAKVIVF